MKKSIIIVLSLLFVGSLVSFKTLETTFNDWTVLGKKHVSKGADHDVLMVTYRKGTFNKLKLKVTKSPVHITNIKVVYANGNSEKISINKNFSKGEFSKSYDLIGKNRIIKKIVFNYRTKLFAKGRANIIVFGKH